MRKPVAGEGLGSAAAIQLSLFPIFPSRTPGCAMTWSAARLAIPGGPLQENSNHTPMLFGNTSSVLISPVPDATFALLAGFEKVLGEVLMTRQLALVHA